MDTLSFVLLTFASLNALLLLTPYTVYPWTVRLLSRGPRTPLPEPYVPFVSILIPTYNEELGLKAKLETALAQDYPSDRMEVIVSDDSSSDETVRVASRFVSRGVRLMLSSCREGKWARLKDLVHFARGEVLMFTDAQALLSPGAVTALVQSLGSQEVGAATARYVVEGAPQESGYWSRATSLKEREARADLLLGAHGAAWAIKREALGSFDKPMINDDYALALDARLRGWKVEYAADAVAQEPPTPTLRDNMSRWERIAAGNLEIVRAYSRGLRLHRGRVAWALMATKVLKMMGPVFMLLCAVAVFGLASLHVWAMPYLLAAFALCLAVAPVRRALTFGAAAQWASGVGLLRALRGRQVSWAGQRRASLPGPVAVCKRALDITASVLGLTLSMPVLALCALAIKLDSAGPVLFGQERVRGVRADGSEETFTMFKLRSMRQDAESKTGPTWAQDADPRITRVGYWLRRTRLDELPQLWNVLWGEMSLVGPRPERPFFTAKLRDMIPGYDDRMMRLKPGITGWAQIHCGYDTSIDSVRQKVLFDLSYVAHMYSLPRYFWMESRVLMATVVVALTGRGAK